MKAQKVKNISYLCKCEFALVDDAKKEVVILPQGAEIVSLNLEITKECAGANVSVGLDDEVNYFLNNINAKDKGFTQSSKLATCAKQSVITAKMQGFNNNGQSKAILRVMYFLPSEILVEY